MNCQCRYPTIKPPAMGPSMGPMRAGMATKLITRMSSDLAKVRTRMSPADRDHHGSPASLQDSAGDEQMDIVRDAAKDGPESEEADRGREHPTRTEAIGHPAADGNENREAQRVAGQHRFHAERGDPEGLRDDWHGRVQDCRVERLHEKCDGDQPREKLLA